MFEFKNKRFLDSIENAFLDLLRKQGNIWISNVSGIANAAFPVIGLPGGIGIPVILDISLLASCNLS